jgi:hypothetical protein
MPRPIFPTAERRRLEVFFAMTTAGFGMFLLLPLASLAAPSAEHLAGMASERAWGGLFLSNGAMHCVWLAVNGARWWSGILRYFAAMGSAILYATWAAGFYAYNPASTAVFTYSALAIGALFCCAFAWRDTLTAVRLRRARLAYA